MTRSIDVLDSVRLNFNEGGLFIFNPKLFNGLGGMAFVAAWWGIWHLIAGFGLATFYAKKGIAHN